MWFLLTSFQSLVFHLVQGYLSAEIQSLFLSMSLSDGQWPEERVWMWSFLEHEGLDSAQKHKAGAAEGRVLAFSARWVFAVLCGVGPK